MADSNIIRNGDFSAGIEAWYPNGCEAFVVSSDPFSSDSISESSSCGYAVVTNRKETWQGLEQDITTQVSPGITYAVTTSVGVSGPSHESAKILATVRLEYEDSPTKYLFIGKTRASRNKWVDLEGTFSISNVADRVVFYLEGPPPGIDLLIKSVTIHCESDDQFERSRELCSAPEADHHIFLNSSFSDGLKHWSGRGCNLMLHESLAGGKILPHSGTCFASAAERTHDWSGIEQDITERVQRKVVYEASSLVRLSHSKHTVLATLYVQYLDQREEYIGISSVEANHEDWVELKGKFLMNGSPARAVVYIEGPPPGIDVFVDHFDVKPAEKSPTSRRPYIESHAFGMNIVSNSHLSDGTVEGWSHLGDDCHLSVGEGSPRILPPLARDALRTTHEYLSGRYVLATNRSETWMGPYQKITDKVKLFVTYQVSAWVKIDSRGVTSPQDVNIALSVDNDWVNGGKVEVDDGDWHEVVGSFRIEKQAKEVMLYVQGPSPGVDLMVSGLQIFAVDRKARLSYLRGQAHVVRKRDVRLKVSGLDAIELLGATVNIRQTRNSFPFGSCISRSNIDNEDFVDFFIKNFDWAVFGNELKWYWTEPEQGSFNYRDADEMVGFCEKYNIETRGHCIFWEVESHVQPWVQQLSDCELEAAVESRVTDLLTRYNGKFRHYDVNNEMLHGSFYRDRLGSDARARMFRTAHELDPLATLFLNEYHIEDGYDGRSSPEKYIKLVHKLQKKGAPVGGIAIQGHITSPVGHIVRSALDKLSTLGLPIWFTELDVSSVNEHVRGDDLEVMLWEAFAHPAVEGVMLWGFWELFMSREHSHLVNADGEVNEAGKRFLEIKREWMTFVDGVIEDEGGFEFRGYHGSYTVEVVTSKGKYVKNFVVDKGNSPIEIIIDL